MPHAGHFICGNECRFTLNTYIPNKNGGFIVSTVGEYLPDSEVQKIFYHSRTGKVLPRGDAGQAAFIRELGFEEIGLGRKYETMVFEAQVAPDACCPYRMTSGEKDFEGYNDPGKAREGHMAMCEKWSRK